ncbi:sigma-70 family RNA polymerase sigma factor (plasmid) [Paraclostridium bifermentans]|uniref:Anti-sigma-W factor RsiW n=1 Tax=Paraclostridium bifermentans TaxID=1490 RepID=A0ABY8R9L3_PARBF|nr:sigma-70 family RNA polymerase sigma factor [Paraclostridium bifermentans]
MTFEEIFKSQYTYVVKYVMKIVKSQEVAESIAQDVFIQLYKTNWKEIENIKAWLIKTAIYSSYNHIRSEKRHELRIEKASLNLETIDVQTLDDRYIKKEEIKNVRNTMNELREQDKKILILRYSGFKYKEIAEILGVEKSSIGTMLVRLKRNLRKYTQKKRGGNYMKCYESGELQAYIDGELSLDMMKKVSKHLDGCEVCQHKFNELVEVNDYKTSLENQSDLQNKIDIEVEWDTFNSKLERKSKLNVIKGRFNNMNKMKKFSRVAAASLLVFIGGSGVAMATYNLFSQHVLEDDVVNKGLVREDGSVVDSTKEGKFKPLDIKIEDKDIIVRLNRIIYR